jgi:hypothetical protein
LSYHGRRKQNYLPIKFNDVLRLVTATNENNRIGSGDA